MHYIRFLRPPRVASSGKTHQIELLFIISTDLGDSLLFPDEPLELAVEAYVGGSGASPIPLSGKDQVVWKPGQRVVKSTFRIPPPVSKALTAGRDIELCIRPEGKFSADEAQAVLPRGSGEEDGLVMPVWLTLNSGGGSEQETSTRKLRLWEASGEQSQLEIFEDVGEPKSLARHVWDGGLVTVCALGGLVHDPALEASQGSCIQAVKSILLQERPINILELGCGVGVLGLGVATVCSAMKPPGEPHRRTVLMTDLEDAEEQVRSNIDRVPDLPGTELLYENLDWEDGRHGRFGTNIKARTWDLIMFSDCTYNVDVLPALVETLAALHRGNQTRHDGQAPTKLFLATKVRHSSEAEVFDLIAADQWIKLQQQTIALPVLGADSQRVELYLYEKQ